MAYIFSDSFDFYTPNSDNSPDWVYGGWSDGASCLFDSTITRFGTGKSFSPAYGSYLIKSNLSNSSDTVFVNVSIYTKSLAASDPIAHITLSDGSTSQVSITFNAGGSISLKLGDYNGSVIATYTNAFIATEWNNFQFKIKIASAGGGTFDVRKNGNSSSNFSATGLTTRVTSNSYINSVKLSELGSFSRLFYFDDFYMFDNNPASAPSDWTGDIRSYSLTATSDTAQKQFTPSGSPNNYANVGKFAPNTATYNYASTVGYEDLFDITNLSVSPTQIIGVVTKTVMSKSDTNPRNGQPVIKSNATSSDGTSVALSSSFIGYINNWSTDPDTLAAWTASGVNALQIGYKVSA